VGRAGFGHNTLLSRPDIMAASYHAHLYFLPEQRSEAAALHALLAERLPHCWLGRLIDREVGPHTRPMFELNFAADEYDSVVALLERERGTLPVLIHPVIADEFVGHTEAARWLGEPLPLKLETLPRG